MDFIALLPSTTTTGFSSVEQFAGETTRGIISGGLGQRFTPGANIAAGNAAADGDRLRPGPDSWHLARRDLTSTSGPVVVGVVEHFNGMLAGLFFR